MSLYNMLFGENRLSGYLLSALGVTKNDIPRYRDCFLDGDEIVIHTRTGGGNRDEYQDQNDNLTNIEGYLRDEDDNYDSTYANFYFRIPDAFKPLLTMLSDISDGIQAPPSEKWKALFDGLRSGEKTPETERALKVGESILGQIAIFSTPKEPI